MSGALENPLYDLAAHDYVRHTETSLFNARYERPAMLAAIGDITGRRVLDAGCAGGSYETALAPKAASIVALDASATMIAMVEALKLPNVTARVHDLAAPLDFLDDGCFDLVMSSLTLHYLADWTTALREFRRVLVPGGRLVISTHHPAMTGSTVPSYFDTTLVTETWQIANVDREVRFYHRSLEAILDPIIDAGFTLQRAIEPHLEQRADATAAERRLAVRPWFLIIEARAPRQ